MVTITRDRYVVVNILADNLTISLNEIKTNIWHTFQQIYGISGSSSAGLFFEHFDENNQKGIIRCSHDSLSSLLTVLALITEINEKNVQIYPLYISGIINKAKKISRTEITQDNNID